MVVVRLTAVPPRRSISKRSPPTSGMLVSQRVEPSMAQNPFSGSRRPWGP